MICVKETTALKICAKTNRMYVFFHSKITGFPSHSCSQNKKNNNLRKSKSYCIESEGFYLFKKSLALLDRELPRLGMLFFGQYRPF